MLKQLKWVALVGLLGAVVFTAGCKVRGGGHLVSQLTGEKATFSFNGTYSLDEGRFVGRGTYTDRIKAGPDSQTLVTQLHMSEEDLEFVLEELGGPDALLEAFEYFNDEVVVPCLIENGYDEDPEGAFVGVGRFVTRSPQDLRGADGVFLLLQWDAGEPGAGEGDLTAIFLYDPDTGFEYVNCGPISGGNIQAEFDE